MFIKEHSFGIKITLYLVVVTGLLVFWTCNRTLMAENWGFLAVLVLLLALFFFYMQFEGSPVSSREIAVIAVMAVVAALARVVFAAIPNIQATTFIVIVSGFVFGPRSGFMIGSTAALVSNFFLGQGPWTPCQMFAWGLVGLTAGLLGLKSQGGTPLMVFFSFIWGYIFSWLMNLWFWAAFVQPLTWESLLVTYAASFVFDTAHAVSNVFFFLFLGKRLITVLSRFQRRLSYTQVVDANSLN